MVPVPVTSFETIILKATRLQVHRFAKCDCSNNREIKDTTDKLKKNKRKNQNQGSQDIVMCPLNSMLEDEVNIGNFKDENMKANSVDSYKNVPQINVC